MKQMFLVQGYVGHFKAESNDFNNNYEHWGKIPKLHFLSHGYLTKKNILLDISYWYWGENYLKFTK